MNNRIYKTTAELTPFIKDMTKDGKSVRITVTGNSMFPLFTHLRDSVVVKKTDDYKKYDVILYLRTTGDLVLHRVVKKKDGVYYLCGDNQTVVEHPIYEDQIIAKVISYTRKGKEVEFKSFFNMLFARFWCLNIKLRKPVLLFALKVWRKINEKH